MQGGSVPPFPEQEGGACLSTTINWYSYAHLKFIDDLKEGRGRVISLDFDIDDIKAGLSINLRSREQQH